MKSACIFILCYFLFVSNTNSQSQFIKAGIYNSSDDIYTDIFPDDSIPLIGSGMHNAEGELVLDVNQDGKNDFKFISKWFGALGGGTSSFCIQSLDTISALILSRLDSCMVFPWPNTKKAYFVPIQLNYGDSISSNLVYDKNISYIRAYGYGNFVYPQFNNWDGVGERFIGFKLYALGDTLFGWIRIEVFSTGAFLIKDYACNKTKSTTFLIYPNPADSHIIVITEMEAGKIKLFNSLGKLVMSIPMTSDNNFYTISTSILPMGTYVLSLDNGKSKKSKKLIVHHSL